MTWLTSVKSVVTSFSLASMIYYLSRHYPTSQAKHTQSYKGRELLWTEDANCSVASYNDFPRLPIPGGPATATIISLLIIAYLFIFLARICEKYLVTAIKIICYELALSSDVAGATLMAAAMSSPDLFVNLVGTFVTEGDIGIGAVVGCGVFNSLALPALCFFLSPTNVIRLEFYPLTRDCLFYSLAVLVLTVSLQDHKIEWHEALLLVSLYVLYILIMSFNSWFRRRIEYFIERIQRKRDALKTDSWPLLTKSYSTMSYGIEEDLMSLDQIHHNGGMEWPWPWRRAALPWWLITAPIDLILAATLPHPRRPEGQPKLYLLTFLISLLWIALISYLIAWVITIAGYELKIPDSLLGLTFIAIGMSVPEAASSIIVAKQGHGSMALSNSLGANNFDILICLGIPWLLKATYFPSEFGHYIVVNSHSLGYSSLLQLSTVFILYTSLAFNRFRLDKNIACICCVIYILFFLASCLLELNVFFIGNLPPCP